MTALLVNGFPFQMLHTVKDVRITFAVIMNFTRREDNGASHLCASETENFRD